MRGGGGNAASKPMEKSRRCVEQKKLDPEEEPGSVWCRVHEVQEQAKRTDGDSVGAVIIWGGVAAWERA